MRRFRAIALLAGVTAVALIPLYGDIRPASAVSHPEWARMMLRGLGLLVDTPGVNDTAAQAFATLSGRDSHAWPADRYVRGKRVESFEEDGRPRVRPRGGIGEVVYAMGIARPGDYRLRFSLSGAAPAEAEMTKAGSDEVVRSFTVPSTAVVGWADAGELHLDPGAYDATVLLPEGSVLDYVELAPPCLHPIEPRGGWKAAAVATTEDVAVTLLQALDLEAELPPAAVPLEFRGEDLVLESAGRGAVLLADIPEAGLYTLSVFGVAGSGQRWMADGCRKSVICPTTDSRARWRTVLSADLSMGPHAFTVRLGPGAVVERVRLERKKDTPADYVAALNRLDLDLGTSASITREKADEARRFLERRRAQQKAELCGDILQPGTQVADFATTGPGAGGGGAGGGGEGGSGGGGGPGGGGDGGGGGGSAPPPVIPPLPPASPILPNAFAGNR